MPQRLTEKRDIDLIKKKKQKLTSIRCAGFNLTHDHAAPKNRCFIIQFTAVAKFIQQFFFYCASFFFRWRNSYCYESICLIHIYIWSAFKRRYSINPERNNNSCLYVTRASNVFVQKLW